MGRRYGRISASGLIAERFFTDLQAGFCHPPLSHIVLAMVDKPAQACTPDGGTGEEPTSGESMQRLECEVLLSLRQRVEVFVTDEMGLRHMRAQDSTFRGLDSEVLVPIRQ